MSSIHRVCRTSSKRWNSSSLFFLTPVENPTSNVWYEMVPVVEINLQGRCRKSPPWPRWMENSQEISELTGHGDPGSITSYSHNALEKQRRMSNKLAGFSSSATTTTNANSGSSAQVLREVAVNSQSPALPTTVQNNTASINEDGSHSAFTARALGGLFTGVTFSNSPVNISISFQSNVNKWQLSFSPVFALYLRWAETQFQCDFLVLSHFSFEEVKHYKTLDKKGGELFDCKL